MYKKILVLFLCCFCHVIFIQAQIKESDILGEWLTQKKDSRILIFKQGDKYFGKIVWGNNSLTKDEHNPDKNLRNRELMNLVILTGFKYDGDDVWEDGKVYDPIEGKTYSCKITLKTAQRLSIRGYVGISLFGRSEVWTKYK